MGHVHNAHEPEDEREPAGNDEVEARQCQPVQCDANEDGEVAVRGEAVSGRLVDHPADGDAGDDAAEAGRDVAFTSTSESRCPQGRST